MDSNIHKILSEVNTSIGSDDNNSEDEVEESYFVLLIKDGKKVKRSKKELLKVAPQLLKAFLNPSPEIISSSSSSEDSALEVGKNLMKVDKNKPNFSFSEEEESNSDSDVVISSKRRKIELEEKKEKERIKMRKLKGKEKEVIIIDSDDDEDEEEESEVEVEDHDADNDAASFEEEVSNVSEEEEDNSSDSAGYRSKKKKKQKSKPRKEATRQSSRSTRHQKTFDIEIQDSDEEDVQSSSTEINNKNNQRKTRSTVINRGLNASGSSSDEVHLKILLFVSKGGIKSVEDKNKVDKVVVDESSDEDYDDNENGHSTNNKLLPQEEHRKKCAKCDRGKAENLLANFKNRKGGNRNNKSKRKRKNEEEAYDTDQEKDMLLKLGAWYECSNCIDVYHFGCLQGDLKKEIIKILNTEHEALHRPPSPPIDINAMDVDESRSSPKITLPPIPRREKIELEPDRVMVLPKCWNCKKIGGRRCFGCGVNGRIKLAPIEEVKDRKEGQSPTEINSPREIRREVPGLMFRCLTCTRTSHYGCLAKEDEESFSFDFEDHSQGYLDYGSCHQCYDFTYKLESILAWKEVDNLAIEIEEGDIGPDEQVIKKKDDKSGKVFTVPNEKDPLANAEYLIKWEGQSFRKLEWVPHSYLAAKYRLKLKYFLAKGSKISFESPNEDEAEEALQTEEEEENEKESVTVSASAPYPDPEAAERIPPAWSTVDRVLEVWYFSQIGGDPVPHEKVRNLSDDPEESILRVKECRFKWSDLPYSASTIEEPPQPNEKRYDKYLKAYKNYLIASEPSMLVPTLSANQLKELNKPRNQKHFPFVKSQPKVVTGGKLMDFQIEGVNFLFAKWWMRKGCILGDEMGLGKTVQVITLISMLISEQGARPFLIVVPNSTIGNWMREFDRWCPSIRVVAYSGLQKDREIVEEFELFGKSTKSLKTHVIVTTYETMQNCSKKFRSTRFDIVVVDESQRLKSGESGLLFQALNSLDVNMRILLSGTPFQNNIRELFNMLLFIDPIQYPDVKALELKYQDLTAAKVEEVRGLLRPHLFRRTKDTVLNLPPLNETVLHVSITPLQRKLYKSVLGNNLEAIQSICHPSSKKGKSKKPKLVLSNAYIQLRKILGHPYLISQSLENIDCSEQEQHRNLVEASAKLILLEKLLPKLQAAGHRVLIFSQFKIVLNILETFLAGINLKFLRLDGDTPSLDRQRGIDTFNAENSKIFCYLLSTRAGGAGINLATADTVILYDQDFNPQQDLQATSRAHRFGQTKPVQVYRLIVKGTYEEQIFLTGNKKLGLDHMIIQRIDAEVDEADDIEGILQFGARAIFDDEEAAATAITWSDQRIDKLIATVPVSKPKGETPSGAFATPLIYDVTNDGFIEVDVDLLEVEKGKTDGNFWAAILKQNEEAQALALAIKEANVGRGKRNRKSVTYVEKGSRNEEPALKKQRALDEEADADFAAPLTDDDDDDDEDEYSVDNIESTVLDGINIDPSAPVDPNAPIKRKRVRKPKVLPSLQDPSQSGAPNRLPHGPLLPLPSAYRQESQLAKLNNRSTQNLQQSVSKPLPRDVAEYNQKKNQAHKSNIDQLRRCSIQFADPGIDKLLKDASDATDRSSARKYIEQAATLIRVRMGIPEPIKAPVSASAPAPSNSRTSEAQPISNPTVARKSSITGPATNNQNQSNSNPSAGKRTSIPGSTITQPRPNPAVDRRTSTGGVSKQQAIIPIPIVGSSNPQIQSNASVVGRTSIGGVSKPQVKASPPSEPIIPIPIVGPSNPQIQPNPSVSIKNTSVGGTSNLQSKSSSNSLLGRSNSATSSSSSQTTTKRLERERDFYIEVPLASSRKFVPRPTTTNVDSTSVNSDSKGRNQVGAGSGSTSKSTSSKNLDERKVGNVVNSPAESNGRSKGEKVQEKDYKVEKVVNRAIGNKVIKKSQVIDLTLDSDDED